MQLYMPGLLSRKSHFTAKNIGFCSQAGPAENQIHFQYTKEFCLPRSEELHKTLNMKLSCNFEILAKYLSINKSP